MLRPTCITSSRSTCRRSVGLSLIWHIMDTHHVYEGEHSKTNRQTYERARKFFQHYYCRVLLEATKIVVTLANKASMVYLSVQNGLTF